MGINDWFHLTIDLLSVLTKENTAILHIIADIKEKMQTINFVRPFMPRIFLSAILH